MEGVGPNYTVVTETESFEKEKVQWAGNPNKNFAVLKRQLPFKKSPLKREREKKE